MARDTILGNVASFFGNILGGVRGRTNLAAWGVAGMAAYYIWVKPEREAHEEREARAALYRANFERATADSQASEGRATDS